MKVTLYSGNAQQSWNTAEFLGLTYNAGDQGTHAAELEAHRTARCVWPMFLYTDTSCDTVRQAKRETTPCENRVIQRMCGSLSSHATSAALHTTFTTGPFSPTLPRCVQRSRVPSLATTTCHINCCRIYRGGLGFCTLLGSIHMLPVVARMHNKVTDA